MEGCVAVHGNVFRGNFVSREEDNLAEYSVSNIISMHCMGSYILVQLDIYIYEYIGTSL